MKNEIDGLKKEETIVNYKIKKGMIVVYYLEGKPAFFTNTKEQEQRIKDKMEEQAKAFIGVDKATMTKINKKCKLQKVIYLLGIGSAAFVGAALSFVTSGISFATILLAVIMGSGFSLFANDLRNEKNKAVNIEKYKYYFDNQEQLEKTYSKLQTKQKSIIKESSNKLENKINDKFGVDKSFNINNVDKNTLESLKSALIEIKRYQDVENKSMDNDSIEVNKRLYK